MRRGHAVNLESFLRWQTGLWVIVELLAGNDMDVMPTRGQIGRQVTDQLAGGGMIRRKEAIEEEDAFHARSIGRD